ncbi:unnamed protein product [Rhizoctonia solani]|uniref:Uncharacterized protein n=1 Tax=Rhizoctonia solani TaxID=456999 RepID=A0A8H3D045_9AGAM|nr:unnamed protein product [Rhizoctonia solani]
MLKLLPTDMVFIIIQFVIWKPRTCERTSELQLAKRKFQKGFASACKAYRGMYMDEWSRCLTLHEVEDWKFAINHEFAAHVRVLTLKEKALLSHAAVKAHIDISGFKRICALTLDCHNDVGHSTSLGVKAQWSYKKIIPNLPKNLKSLTILNAHGPDLQVIQKAIKQCRNLESLTLGRCTKFNRPICCEFWANFPNDHDSYFSGKGVDGYASALVAELQGLTHLKSIFVNVYLTDTKYLNETSPTTEPVIEPPQPTITPATSLTTMTAKRASNSQAQAPLDMPATSSSAQSQQKDVKSKDQEDTEEAEKAAAKILFDCHASLRTVGFISYWSKDHLGWSVQQRNEDKELKSPDPGGELDGINAVEVCKSI